jgi:hypothetical protein
MKDIPLDKRSTQESLAFQLGVSRSWVRRNIAKGSIRLGKSVVKPRLSDKNKLLRMRYVLSKVEKEDGIRKFKGFYDHIHIDEKWFYITKVKKQFLLLPEEEVPLRQVQSKHFITKVMFLAAAARPRKSTETGQWDFDGKIGIWPFVESVPAKRTSKNRPKGTLETKSVPVTRELYLDFLRFKLLPAIGEKFPDLDSPLVVQQDNAGPHVQANHPDFIEEANSMGINISLRCQPPNSPDFNVLDLGFFNSIQSLQQQKSANTIDELIEHVIDAYYEVKPDTLNKVWLTLMSCMEESLWVDGSNNYVIPHLKKNLFAATGELPDRLELSDNIYAFSLSYILDNETDSEDENDSDAENY